MINVKPSMMCGHDGYPKPNEWLNTWPRDQVWFEMFPKMATPMGFWAVRYDIETPFKDDTIEILKL